MDLAASSLVASCFFFSFFFTLLIDAPA
jgi:hypothetical protein